jgi:hypothetical protein
VVSDKGALLHLFGTLLVHLLRSDRPVHADFAKHNGWPVPASSGPSVLRRPAVGAHSVPIYAIHPVSLAELALQMISQYPSLFLAFSYRVFGRFIGL